MGQGGGFVTIGRTMTEASDVFLQSWAPKPLLGESPQTTEHPRSHLAAIASQLTLLFSRHRALVIIAGPHCQRHHLPYRQSGLGGQCAWV